MLQNQALPVSWGWVAGNGWDHCEITPTDIMYV